MRYRSALRDRTIIGFTLIELLLLLAILGLTLTFAAPPLQNYSRTLRVRLAAEEIAAVMKRARMYAARHGANVAVKFTTDAETREVTYALYRDGDGDGVRNRDIDDGTDPEVWAPCRLNYLGEKVGIGFPPGIRPRHPGDPSRRLDRLDDPIRFNRSDLASFGNLGTATPGSVYVSDGVRHLAAVRTSHRTGAIRVLVYSFVDETWR